MKYITLKSDLKMDFINPLNSSILLTKGHLCFANRYLHLYWIENNKSIVAQSISEYIPIAELKNIFDDISKHITYHQAETFIFDKSSFNTFSQEALIYYYQVWKPNATILGIKSFRHILPNSISFQFSLKKAKELLFKENKEIYTEDIEYYEHIDEAII